jgi:chromosome segregation ATPase
MPEETAQERERKAIQLAEQRGRRQQEVDGRLDEHDRRFDRINGSIERSARAQEGTNRELGALKKGLEDVVAKLETGEAVSAALAKAAVSRREFWMGVLVVVATLAGALLGGGHV